MKISTIAALIFSSLFFLTAHGQAEEHYIYKDPQGRRVISNQKPQAGKLDLPEFRETQIQQVQESSSTRSTNQLEGSPKQDQKK